MSCRRSPCRRPLAPLRRHLHQRGEGGGAGGVAEGGRGQVAALLLRGPATPELGEGGGLSSCSRPPPPPPPSPSPRAPGWNRWGGARSAPRPAQPCPAPLAAAPARAPSSGSCRSAGRSAKGLGRAALPGPKSRALLLKAPRMLLLLRAGRVEEGEGALQLQSPARQRPSPRSPAGRGGSCCKKPTKKTPASS